MLELVNFHKSYGGRDVLSGASLAVAAGEAVALLGANGSGKTTLLRCAVGLHHLDRGVVLIDGVDVTRELVTARRGLSYLPQRSEFPSTLTVREILQVTAELRGVQPNAVERELSLCGLRDLAHRTVCRLSGGERQRVALAALLLPEVRVYLIDEPTASLDEEAVKMFMDRLGALRDSGRAVLFTSHAGSDVDRLATRCVVLRYGRIEETSDPLKEDQDDRYYTVPVGSADVDGYQLLPGGG